MINGAPWFVAKDVCEGLGYGASNRWNALQALKPEEKGNASVITPGGVQKMIVISRHGLRKLFMRSNKPEAIVFQDWLNDVVDSIEDTGMYVTESKAKAIQHDLTTDEGTLSYLAELSQQLIKRAQFAESQVEEMKPIVQIYDSAWKGESACFTEFFQFALSTRVSSNDCGKLKKQLVEAGVLANRHGQLEPTDAYLPYFKFKPFVNPRGRDNLELHVRSDKRHELAAKVRPFLSI